MQDDFKLHPALLLYSMDHLFNIQMVKPNELRIGNYLTKNGETFAISSGIIEYIDAYPNVHGFKPTPLTEEWLLKFGCEKDEYGVWNTDSALCIHLSDGEFICRIIFRRIVLKYVHQFQNLYFALQEEELTIKE